MEVNATLALNITIVSTAHISAWPIIGNSLFAHILYLSRVHNLQADQGGKLAALKESRDEGIAKGVVELLVRQVLDLLEAEAFLLYDSLVDNFAVDEVVDVALFELCSC